MEYWKQILLAIIGSGVISSVIAIYANWGILKRKMKLENRRRAIDLWRQRIQNVFNDQSFRETAEFSQMKPYLSKQIEKELNPPVIPGKEYIINLRGAIGRDKLKDRLLEEIAIIERKWRLL